MENNKQPFVDNTMDILNCINKPHETEKEEKDKKSKKKKKPTPKTKQKKKKSKKPKKSYLIKRNTCQLHIAKLIIALNKINLDDYFCSDEELGTVCGPIGIENEEFLNNSKLNWKFELYDSINSSMFKRKFLTLILTEIMTNLGTVSNNTYKDSMDLVGLDYSPKYYLSENISDINNFTKIFMFGNEYQNIIFKLFKLSLNLNNDIKRTKIYDKVKELTFLLRKNTNNTFCRYNEIPDDILVYSLFQLMYLVITEDLTFKYIPNFQNIENRSLDDNFTDYIKKFGKCIRNSKNISLFYSSFINSNPYIDIELNSDSENLIEGYQALVFIDFFTNNKGIHKLVKKIIK